MRVQTEKLPLQSFRGGEVAWADPSTDCDGTGLVLATSTGAQGCRNGVLVSYSPWKKAP